MKHIKQYEKVIAAKSEKAQRNPLYDFSGKISQTLKSFKDEDPTFSVTKRYIEDDGMITIKAESCLSIQLNYDEKLNSGDMIIHVSFMFQSMEKFYDFVRSELFSYLYYDDFANHLRTVSRRSEPSSRALLKFKFSLNDTDDIINILKNYETYLTSIKFNI